MQIDLCCCIQDERGKPGLANYPESTNDTSPNKKTGCQPTIPASNTCRTGVWYHTEYCRLIDLLFSTLPLTNFSSSLAVIGRVRSCGFRRREVWWPSCAAPEPRLRGRGKVCPPMFLMSFTTRFSRAVCAHALPSALGGRRWGSAGTLPAVLSPHDNSHSTHWISRDFLRFRVCRLHGPPNPPRCRCLAILARCRHPRMPRARALPPSGRRQCARSCLLVEKIATTRHNVFVILHWKESPHVGTLHVGFGVSFVGIEISQSGIRGIWLICE